MIPPPRFSSLKSVLSALEKPAWTYGFQQDSAWRPENPDLASDSHELESVKQEPSSSWLMNDLKCGRGWTLGSCSVRHASSKLHCCGKRRIDLLSCWVCVAPAIRPRKGEEDQKEGRSRIETIRTAECKWGVVLVGGERERDVWRWRLGNEAEKWRERQTEM